MRYIIVMLAAVGFLAAQDFTTMGIDTTVNSAPTGSVTASFAFKNPDKLFSPNYFQWIIRNDDQFAHCMKLIHDESTCQLTNQKVFTGTPLTYTFPATGRYSVLLIAQQGVQSRRYFAEVRINPPIEVTNASHMAH